MSPETAQCSTVKNLYFVLLHLNEIRVSITSAHQMTLDNTIPKRDLQKLKMKVGWFPNLIWFSSGETQIVGSKMLDIIFKTP